MISRPFKRMMVFIDGENLVLRFQDMCSKAIIQSPVVHVRDVFVWHPSIIPINYVDILRVNYYTYFVGDNNKGKELEKKIKGLEFSTPAYVTQVQNSSYVYPVLFKKEKQSKAKGVDITITIDILSHVYKNSIDVVYLLTGDGDYLPLIEEIIKSGKNVYVGAFSSGLNPEIPIKADAFYPLDNIFFKRPDV